MAHCIAALSQHNRKRAIPDFCVEQYARSFTVWLEWLLDWSFEALTRWSQANRFTSQAMIRPSPILRCRCCRLLKTKWEYRQVRMQHEHPNVCCEYACKNKCEECHRGFKLQPRCTSQATELTKKPGHPKNSQPTQTSYLSFGNCVGSFGLLQLKKLQPQNNKGEKIPPEREQLEAVAVGPQHSAPYMTSFRCNQNHCKAETLHGDGCRGWCIKAATKPSTTDHNHAVYQILTCICQPPFPSYPTLCRSFYQTRKTLHHLG